MPIFVDHAGLNTLIHDELDLDTNTRALNDRTHPQVDLAIRAPDASNARFIELSTSGYPTTGGITFSFWINLDSSVKPDRTVFDSQSGGQEVFIIFFKSSVFGLTFIDNGGNNKTWYYNSIDTSDLTGTWNHIYIAWGGDFSVDPNVYLNNVYHAPSSNAGAGSGTTYNSITTYSLFSKVADGSTLEGSLQSFTFYEISGTLSLLQSLYNNGEALNENLPNGSDILFHYALGSESDDLTIFVDIDGVDQDITAIVLSPTTGSKDGDQLASSAGSGLNSGKHFTTAGVSHGKTLTTILPNTYVGRINFPQQLAAINTHRNGPYGNSTWTQTRASRNPIIRHHNSTNTMTFVTQPGPIRNVLPSGELRVRDRYSGLYSFKEPVVTQKCYPLVWNVGRHFKDDDGLVDLDNPQRFSILSSYGNELIGFSNERVNKLLKFDPDEEQTEYNAITEMYLENGLDKLDSPLTHWEFLYYRETVFPISKQQYRLESRNRPTFASFYRHDPTKRKRSFTTGTSDENFGAPSSYFAAAYPIYASITQSTWPLDPVSDFLIYSPTTTDSAYDANNITASEGGVLQSRDSKWTSASKSGMTSTNQNTVRNTLELLDTVIFPYPTYARRSSLNTTQSVTSPSGMEIPETGGLGFIHLFQGHAYWDAGVKREIRNANGSYSSSAKYPFYDSYEDYSNDIKNYGKNYSVIPEFRMSNQVEDYLRTDGEIELDMFEITGGISGITSSVDEDFFEIYSNSDFLKHFEIIKEDHKDFTNFDVLALRCKAIKKFLPYEGFYPCQRTVDLAKQFYKSYRDDITLSNESEVDLTGFNYGTSFIMDPLFRPGVLFNTIKSGVAVDYPIITGSTSIEIFGERADPADRSYSKGNFLLRDQFDKRIPFEALVEPRNYLANYHITSQEPHPSGNVSASAYWSGLGNESYILMANNFLAETINFFLPEGQLTSIVSKRQEDITLQSGSVYGMRVKMRRSMSGSRGSVYHYDDPGVPYIPPQDITSGSLKETFTMYSRPSAFGPPTEGRNDFSFDTNEVDRSDAVLHNFTMLGRNINNSKFISGSGFLAAVLDSTKTGLTASSDSRNGFNFPFTPPYYHGEAWCHITFTASSDTMTIKEIQDSSTYEYVRYDNTFLSVQSASGSIDRVSLEGKSSNFGAQNFFTINNNAMQLSSSLNIRGVGSVKSSNPDAAAGSIVVDTATQEGNRWVIQTKFETPMLNFNHINSASANITLPANLSASVPRGMWHQYGRIPQSDEGVFIQVNPIPENYQFQVLGKTIGSPSANGGVMEDMSEALGFSGFGTKIGRLALTKEISEAVVAIPFIEFEGKRQFFVVDVDKVNTFKRAREEGNIDTYNSLITGEPHQQIGRSLLNQMIKMEKFIFPPSFDFLNFNNVTPIAMYIFEFTHTLSQRDLQDIWQNLPPDVGNEFEVQEIAITHPLLKKELLGRGSSKGNTPIPLPERLRWMVFKVKQRAENNYFGKTVLRNSKVNQPAGRGGVTRDEYGLPRQFQYNWPYDFFSLVEMVRIDAEAEIGSVEQSDIDGYTDDIPEWKPKQSSRNKIEAVIGGIEDDPIIETNPVPEEAEDAFIETDVQRDITIEEEGVEDIPQSFLDTQDTNQWGAYREAKRIFNNNGSRDNWRSSNLSDYLPDLNIAYNGFNQGRYAQSVGTLGENLTSDSSLRLIFWYSSWGQRQRRISVVPSGMGLPPAGLLANIGSQPPPKPSGTDISSAYGAFITTFREPYPAGNEAIFNNYYEDALRALKSEDAAVHTWYGFDDDPYSKPYYVDVRSPYDEYLEQRQRLFGY